MSDGGNPMLALLAPTDLGEVLLQRAGLAGVVATSSGLGGDAVAALAASLEGPARVVALVLDAAVEGARLTAIVAKAQESGKDIVLMPGPDASIPVWRAFLEPQGAVVAESLRGFCDIAFYLATTPDRSRPQGSGVAIVTGGGGTGVIVTDLCVAGGLTVPPLSDETRSRLAPLMPPIASLANPVDTTPQIHAGPWAQNYPAALDQIAADPGISAVIFPVSALTGTYGDRAEEVIAFRQRSPVHVLVAAELLGPDEFESLGRRGLFNFEDASRAIAAFAALLRVERARKVAVPATSGSATATRSSEPQSALDAVGVAISEAQLRDTERGDSLRTGLTGLPLRLAAVEDAEFGRVVSVSAGGTFAVMLDQVEYSAPTLGPDSATALLNRLALIGAAAKVDRRFDPGLAADALFRFGALAAALPVSDLPLVLDPVIARDGVLTVGAAQIGSAV